MLKLTLKLLILILLPINCFGETVNFCSLNSNHLKNNRIQTNVDDPATRIYISSYFRHLSELFSVKPDFGVIRGKNAYARNKSIKANRDGMILIGRGFLTSENMDDFTLAAIIAHEYAHIYQLYYSGSYYKKSLLKGESTHKKIELHADYISGAYLAIIQIGVYYSSIYNGTPLESALREIRENFDARIFAKKLYRMGDYQFNNITHHGTPEERLDAFTAGYKNLLLIGKKYDFKSQRQLGKKIAHDGRIYIENKY